MILPDKHTRENESLIGVGAVIIQHLTADSYLSDLWDQLKNDPNVGTYDRFIHGLDLLFILGLITTDQNKIIKVSP